MADAFIYDTVRTPRGRGKKDGSLHEITPISLTTQVLQAVRDRSNLDTSLVDDVIWGVVDPVAEQGAVLPRVAALNADYSEDVAGVQVNRFCASGLVATNLAAAITELKKAGVFVIGLDGGGTTLLPNLDLADRPLLIVVGSEGSGLSRLVNEKCDAIVSIPISAATESLNAGIAASVALYEVARVRTPR